MSIIIFFLFFCNLRLYLDWNNKLVIFVQFFALVIPCNMEEPELNNVIIVKDVSVRLH